MSSSERRQHDQAWGFDFGEVGIVNLVPPEYIGDPPLRKKGLFSMFRGSTPAAQEYAKVAASEHPMSVNMRQSFEEAVTNNPEMLQQGDERGYTMLHQLALAGSFDCVDVCLRKGADPNSVTKNGLTPYALAKCMGWKRVMERLEQAGAKP